MPQKEVCVMTLTETLTLNLTSPNLPILCSSIRDSCLRWSCICCWCCRPLEKSYVKNGKPCVPSSVVALAWVVGSGGQWVNDRAITTSITHGPAPLLPPPLPTPSPPPAPPPPAHATATTPEGYHGLPYFVSHGLQQRQHQQQDTASL